MPRIVTSSAMGDWLDSVDSPDATFGAAASISVAIAAEDDVNGPGGGGTGTP
ncbi:MAG: hypothetical protein ACYCS4_07490 [Acidimicrobiales bacterium]